MKLHLGCGYRKLEGYIGIDSRAEVGADECMDVGALQYPCNSVDLIYACHVLEHIPRPRVGKVLEEWRRVLQKGEGVLRISVPDFRFVAERYINLGVHLERLWGLLHGRQDYEENAHFCSYDYETLAKIMGAAGFFRIHAWDPVQVLPPDYDDYSKAELDGFPASLNIEATAK